MTRDTSVPVVMSFSGLDPTGGAGIQADIETLASMGCHAAPVITAITAQDTHDLKALAPVDTVLVIEQARAVLEDCTVGAFKIGMPGSRLNIEAIHSILTDYPDCPVVLDPVLATAAGSSLGDEEILPAMRSLLFPLTTVLTPNSLEARQFAPGSDNLDACAQELLAAGCEFVLITGTHENLPRVVNTLYGSMRRLETFEWERLPSSYHGSGCTLAAAIAGLLAQGLEPFTAIHEAQEYTWEALKHGFMAGSGQRLPNRLFWARNHKD